MSELAIVAIPSQDDYVWKISSEKVPHLTLMMLGDAENNPNLGHIEDYLGHVVESSMCRFGLEVDRRGVLGEQEADVLYFKNPGYNTKMLQTVRRYLLNDRYISEAYNSTMQFPTWTPHLTLGYPKTPAKSDERDYPGFSWMTFDRIALWIGDYEGPEFELKERQYGDEVSMSEIAHYGIKGMKWGVRTKNHGNVELTNVGKSAFNAAKTHRAPDQTKKTYVKKATEAGGLHKVDNKDLDEMIKRMEMERKFSKFMSEEADRRKEGRKAALKFLGEVGKVAVPIALGIVANRVANNMNGGTFRTSSTVSRTVIDGVSKSTALVRR